MRRLGRQAELLSGNLVEGRGFGLVEIDLAQVSFPSKPFDDERVAPGSDGIKEIHIVMAQEIAVILIACLYMFFRCLYPLGIPEGPKAECRHINQ